MREALTAYGLQLIVGAIALFALWKDWDEYPKRSQRWGKLVQRLLAGAVLLVAILSLLETHFDRAGAATDRAKSTAENAALSQQVQQLRDDAKAANDGFRQSFTTLYDKFSQLQAKVQADALLKQNASLLKDIDETKKELTSTQAKLDPKPKAELSASFPTNDTKNLPVLTTTLARTDPVRVSLMIYNLSSVNALNGAVNVQLCDLCAFAFEPAGFQKIAGAPETQRSMDFQHIYSNGVLPLITIEVKVPQNVSPFLISVLANCDTCVTAKRQDLWITLN